MKEGIHEGTQREKKTLNKTRKQTEGKTRRELLSSGLLSCFAAVGSTQESRKRLAVFNQGNN